MLRPCPSDYDDVGRPHGWTGIYEYILCYGRESYAGQYTLVSKAAPLGSYVIRCISLEMAIAETLIESVTQLDPSRPRGNGG